jgi:HK97 gp10 family phage protein
MSIEFDGLDEILKSLDKVVSQEQLEKALMKACLVVERTAKQNAQSFADTGALAGSITSKVEDQAGIVYTPLEYAPYVEYGTGLFAEEGGRKDVPWHYQDDKGEWHTTSGQHPQPYMRPALDTNREEIKRVLREGLLND